MMIIDVKGIYKQCISAVIKRRYNVILTDSELNTIRYTKPKLAYHIEKIESLLIKKRRVKVSQYRKVICIPRGNRYATVMNIKRRNISCDCKLGYISLPKGVTLSSGKIERSANSVLALFKAGSDAPIEGGLHRVIIKDAASESKVTGPLVGNVNHVEINNTGIFLSV